LIDEWMGILTKPEETIAAEKAKASLKQGVINFAIAGFIVGLALGIVLALVGLVFAPLLAMNPTIPQETLNNLQLLGTVGLISIVVLPIVGAIVAIVFSLIGNLIWWLAAKIVEGNGPFSLQYYLFSLSAVPTALACIGACLTAVILEMIPIIGPLISIIILVMAAGFLSIVLLMAYVAAVKETHGFTTLQVALTTGIAHAILLLAIIVIAVIVGVAIFLAAAPRLFVEQVGFVP